jgi:hypothetical protein
MPAALAQAISNSQPQAIHFEIKKAGKIPAFLFDGIETSYLPAIFILSNVSSLMHSSALL